MLKRNFIFLFCFLLSLCYTAQNFESELREAVAEKPKLDIRFDSRHGFINQTGVKVFGFKVGVQYAEKLSFGIGYNQLWSPIERELIIGNEEQTLELAFYNFSPYVEYNFYKDERWLLSIPVQIGFGSSYYNLKTENSTQKINQRFVISYEPAITFEYRLLKYFGLGLGVGYRLMVKPNPVLEEQFTSPVYIFKSKIYFQDLWVDLKKIL